VHAESGLDLQAPPQPAPVSSADPDGLEAIHLGAETTHVPEDLLEAPLESDRRRVFGDLAAFLLDRHLRRMAAMRNPLELRLARLLGRFEKSSGHLALGFARMADYVTERLGISVRRMVDILRMARRLEELPRTAEAFASGQVTASQLRALLRVVTPETESEWLEKAAGLNVRLLEGEVRSALAAENGGGAADDAVATTRGAAGDMNEDADPGQIVTFECSAALRERWRWAVELCRRSAGASEPVWRCAEYIAADYLSGVPDLPSILARACARGERDLEPDAALPAACTRADSGEFDDDVDLFEAVLRGYEEEHGPRDWAPLGARLHVVLPDSVRDDPTDGARELDKKLRSLVAMRQGLAWEQGRLLSTFSRLGLHRVLGFLSFGRYCKERLGLGIRRARQLVALDRRLIGLPSLETAYRHGEVSWVKASAIASVADAASEREWIRLAGSVTVRRLREEVALVEARLEDPACLAGVPSGSRGRPPAVDPARDLGIESPWTRLGASPSDAGTEVQTCARRFEESADGMAAGEVQTCARPGARVRFWAPDDVAALWHHALRVCRLVAGGDLDDWECVARMIDSFERTWDVTRDPKWQRRYRIFERDGWRCRVPGCSSRRNLHAHHVIYRSHGGCDEDENLVVLCATHHQQGVHAGRLRCHGSADGFLRWELGIGACGPPVMTSVEDVLITEGDGPVSPGAPAGVLPS
jgi:hypothetical protein